MEADKKQTLRIQSLRLATTTGSCDNKISRPIVTKYYKNDESSLKWTVR